MLRWKVTANEWFTELVEWLLGSAAMRCNAPWCVSQTSFVDRLDPIAIESGDLRDICQLLLRSSTDSAQYWGVTAYQRLIVYRLLQWGLHHHTHAVYDIARIYFFDTTFTFLAGQGPSDGDFRMVLSDDPPRNLINGHDEARLCLIDEFNTTRPDGSFLPHFQVGTEQEG